MSVLSDALHQNQFPFLIEYLNTEEQSYPPRTTFAGSPAMMTFADRVQTDDDLAPLACSRYYDACTDKVLHYAGKGRDLKDFQNFLNEAQQASIENLLLLTGDKLKGHQDGKHGQARTRYLESVNAVMEAKKQGGFFVGVAFNPFKYLEAERDAQYLKLHKKLKAGADFVITQLGYDLNALKQTIDFLKTAPYSAKLLACVMPLTLGRAQYMVKHQVAGIVITPHMLHVLKQEKQSGLLDRAYIRCAIQILWCRKMGLAGIHLSACHKAHEQSTLEQYILQYQHLDIEQLEALWADLWHIATGREFTPELSHYSYPASSTQMIRYHQLHLMHETIFESKLAKRIGRFIFKSEFWKKTLGASLLLKAEWITKYPIVGCESCGQCRLGETLYICPETCPKGLANGPCGGTHLDRCEFGDRECIHSVKARLAKAVEQTDILKDHLIPTVPLELRGSSSWKNWYMQDET